MPKIDCLKIAKGTELEKSLVGITENMPESKQRELGLKAALAYHKQLHNELQDFKKSIAPDPKKYRKETYAAPDFSEQIKSIKEAGLQRQGSVEIDTANASTFTSQEGDSDLKKKFISDSKKILAALKGITPNLKIIIYDTDASMREALGGSTRGAFDRDINVIYINLESAKRAMDASKRNKSNTVLHEGVHPILNIIAANNPEIIDSLNSQILKLSETVDGVKSVIAYGDSQGEYFNDEALGKMETVVEFISQVANGDIDIKGIKDEGVLARLSKILNDFLKILGVNKNISIEKADDIIKLSKQISEAFDSAATIGVMKVSGNEKPASKISLQRQGEARTDFKRTEKYKSIEQKPLSFFKDEVITITGADWLAAGDLLMPDGSTVNLKGGWAYPAETGNVWATAGKASASGIINKMNESIRDTGVAHLGIRAMTEESAISNYSTFIAAANYIQSALINKDITKKELVARIQSAYKTNKLKGKNSSVSLATKSDKIVEALLYDFSVSAATFEDRKAFLFSVLGGVGLKSKSVWGNLPTSGELLKKVTDPSLVGIRNQSLVAIVRVDSPLTSRQTTAEQDGRIYHDAYPVVIESASTPKVFLLDGAYNIEDAVPKFIDNSTKNEVSVSDYEGQPIFGNKSYTNKFSGGAAQVVRNVKVSESVKPAIQFQGLGDLRDSKHFKFADLKYPDVVFGKIDTESEANIAINFYKKIVDKFNKEFDRQIKLTSTKNADGKFSVKVEYETGLTPKYFAYPSSEMGKHEIVDALTNEVPLTSLRHELIHEMLVKHITDKFERINNLDQSASAASIEDVQRNRAYNYTLEDVFFERVVENIERLPDGKDTFDVSTYGTDVTNRLQEEIKGGVTKGKVMSKLAELLDGSNEWLSTTLTKIFDKVNYDSVKDIRDVAEQVGKKFKTEFDFAKNIFSKDLQRKIFEFTNLFNDEYQGVQTRLAKQIKNPSLEQFTVGYAPFREGNIKSIEGSTKAFENKKYRQWITMANQFAKELGIEASSSKETLGIYGATSTNMEASALLTINATQEQAELFAAMMGSLAPDMQHSVMLNRYDENGQDREHYIRFKTRESAEDFLKKKKLYGISDVSFDPRTNTAIVLDIDRFGAIFNQEKFIKRYGTEIAKHSEYNIVNAFIEERSYEGILQEGRSAIIKQNKGKDGSNINDILKLASTRIIRQSGNRAVLPESKRKALVRSVNDYVSKYRKEFGLSYVKNVGGKVPFSDVLSKEIYEAYNTLKTDNSSDPIVKESYDQLVKEIDAQFKYITEVLGVQVEFIKDDPYDDSVAMMADVYDNNRLKIYQGGDPHPFLDAKDESGFSANEKFRAVHDYFGHAVEGNQFGKRGEEAAWVAHSKMLSPLAQRAMSTETRGQNSWVNNSPVNESSKRKFAEGNDLIKEGRVSEGQALIKEAQSEFQFAEQKVDLLPEELTTLQLQGEGFEADGSSVGGDVTKTLESEAREYKSAEEFINAQTLVYHGSNAPLKKFNNKQGTFFTDDMMMADGYAGGENVYEGYLNLKNPLVIDAKGRKWDNLETPYGKTTQEVAGSLDTKKYDGIIFENIKDSWIDDVDYQDPSTIYYVAKTGDSFLNESQLADLWEQSNKPQNKNLQYQYEPSEIDNAIAEFRESGLTDDEIKDLLELNGNTDAEIDAALLRPAPADSVQVVSGITHVITGETREEYGLPEYQRGQQTFAEWDKEAKERIANGEIGKLITKLLDGGTPSAVEQRMMGMYVAQLDKTASETGSNADIAKLYFAIELSDRIGGSEVARGLVARKGLFQTDKTLGGYWMEQMEASQVDVLTEEQKQQNKKEFEEISAAKEKLEARVAELEKVNAELLAKKNLNTKPKDAKAKKTNTDFKEEREKVFQNISDKLREIRNTPSVVAVPYARELFAIAPDVAKLVKSFAEQGIVKLDEVVRELNNVLKAYIPEITDRDVVDLIAGEYNARKMTRNDIAIKLRDLREEAKLTNRLADLLNGVEPETAGGRVIRNREITDLRNRIKDLKSGKAEGDSEVNKLNNLTKRYKAEYDILKAKLDAGDYTTEKPKTPMLQDEELKKNFPAEYKKALDAKDDLIKLKGEREIRLLREEQKNRSKLSKFSDGFASVLNLPRSLMSSVDFSAPLRQGVVPTISHPIIAFGAFGEMFRTAISQKRFDRYFSDLRESDAFVIMDASGLYVADPLNPKLSVKEEAFMSNLAEKIPFIGRLVKGSERAYVSYLNKMRVDLFKQGADILLSKGKTIDNAPEAYKALASFLNNSTGRGGMTESMEKASPILNSLFFSPRLIAARLNFLNPVYYVNTYRKDPQVGRMLLGDMAKFVAFTMSVLALAKLGCGDDEECGVETDARSTDFGKIRIGDTRYDTWGGFQQYMRFFTQMYTGQSKSINGEIINISGDKDIEGKTYFGSSNSRATGLLRFARGKLAPVPSTVVDLMNRRTVMGDEIKMEFSNPFKKNESLGDKEIDLTDRAKSILFPLIVTDVKEAVKEQGIKAMGTTWLPATFGIGVQTFKKK